MRTYKIYVVKIYTGDVFYNDKENEKWVEVEKHEIKKENYELQTKPSTIEKVLGLVKPKTALADNFLTISL